MRNKDVYEVIEQAEKELDSLRLQLQQKTDALDAYYPLAAEANTLKEENKQLKEFLEEIKKIVHSEQSTYHRIMDIKKKFPMR